MRLQGEITNWNDEKGFGFISPLSGGSSTFVHIKAFSSESHRPEIGDVVSYETAQDKNGRPRAEKVRFSDQSKSKNRSNHQCQDSPLPVLFVALFACMILLSASFGRIPWFVLAAYLAASLLTFTTYKWDKSAAQRGDWRVPESTLHTMALFCGWPGALAAQRLLRHKSRKIEFLSVFWVTVFLNVIAIGYLLWIGSSGFN